MIVIGLVLLTARGRAVAETLDRVVASIGNFVITESDVARELQFERFVDDAPVQPEPSDAGAFNRARDRLIDQKLLDDEADAEGISSDGLADAAAKTLAQIRSRYGNDKAFSAALAVLGMSEKDVLLRLEVQARILQLIDQRLRPTAQVDSGAIANYYRQTFLPAYAKEHSGPGPALADVESQIREILTQKEIDNLLAKWLDQLEKSRQVRIHTF